MKEETAPATDWKVLVSNTVAQRWLCSDLSADTDYAFEVQAEAKGATYKGGREFALISDWSESSVYTTREAQPPSGLLPPTLVDRQLYSIHVTWSPPDQFNGAMVSGYYIRLNCMTLFSSV